ncbi:ATP-binding protein [Paracoccus beibuensis]|uniref:ATP-binding protein n=1 Tax=Paracoccus beibuensis TaxID=547602 RepID=UPI00223E937A|nr:ATP-binding protein [Paracoccus beibuensis]
MKHSESEIGRIISDLRANYVATQRDVMIRDEIDRLLRRDADGKLIADPVRFSGGQETRGILVMDEAGGGKSTILSRVLSSHEALGAGPSGPARFLSSKVFSPATMKSFGCEVLRSTGYAEISERRERWSIWGILRHRLAALGIVCLVIEEAHDLRSSGSVREAMDILNACKSLLSSDPPIIVILCGVPILNELVRMDPQADRRFAKVELPPVTDAHDAPKLESLMVQYCGRAGISPPAGKDAIPRLIHASANRFGMCIENLVNAIEEALNDGADSLTLAHFARSWAATAAVDLRENPFANPEWRSIEVTGRIPATAFGRFKK